MNLSLELQETDIAELAALGRPAFLIVPGERHRLDARSYAQRYSNITVVAPSAGKEKIGEVARIDTSTPDFGDPSIRYVELAADSALEVDCDDGLTIIVSDLIGDIHDESGVGGWLLRVMGFAGDDLRRIIVSHGDTIDADPRWVLRTFAASRD